jgi:hypothetical protein
VRLIHISDSTTKKWRQPGGSVSQEEGFDPQACRPKSAEKLAAQVRRTFLLRFLASGTYCSRLYYRQGKGRLLTRHPRVACHNARRCSSEAGRSLCSACLLPDEQRVLRSARRECSVPHDNGGQQYLTCSPKGRKTCSEAYGR